MGGGVGRTRQVEDLTGRGLSDLAAGLVRTPLPPLRTLVDDPLRALRAVRFATRLGFTIAPDLREALAAPEVVLHTCKPDWHPSIFLFRENKMQVMHIKRKSLPTFDYPPGAVLEPAQVRCYPCDQPSDGRVSGGAGECAQVHEALMKKVSRERVLTELNGMLYGEPPLPLFAPPSVWFSCYGKHLVHQCQLPFLTLVHHTPLPISGNGSSSRL